MIMRNKYSGVCRKCTRLVRRGKGFIKIVPKDEREKVIGMFNKPKFGVYHKNCLN